MVFKGGLSVVLLSFTRVLEAWWFCLRDVLK